MLTSQKLCDVGVHMRHNGLVGLGFGMVKDVYSGFVRSRRPLALVSHILNLILSVLVWFG